MKSKKKRNNDKRVNIILVCIIIVLLALLIVVVATKTNKGQMKDRFLLGKWEGYDGLIYPSFDLNVHVVPHEDVVNYYNDLILSHKVQITEAFDYGLAVPSCYGFSFTDNDNNVILMDGYYDKEKTF